MPLIPTDKTSESSTLFSLDELMTLEETRVKEEEATAATKRKAEYEAALALERRRREEEQARLDQERDARETIERRKNEESARIEGVRQAEVARAQAGLEAQRLEREHELRTAEAGAQREHERLLATVRADAGYRRLTLLAGSMAALFAIAGVTTGALWHQASVAWQTERAELNEALALALAKLDYRDGTISDLEERVDDLEQDRVKLNEKIRGMKKGAVKPPSLTTPPRPPRPPRPVLIPEEPTQPEVPCDPHDPMGGCVDLG